MIDWHFVKFVARVCYAVCMATRISPERLAMIAGKWQPLLSEIAAGDTTINGAIKAAGLTNDDVRAYRRDIAGADLEWKQAKEERADSLVDEIHATLNNSKLDPQYARVKIDALKWLAAKFYPHFYNDKATLDINVKTLDLTQIVNAAQARLIAARAERVIDGTVIDNEHIALRDLL